jgi:hypothetical protein
MGARPVLCWPGSGHFGVIPRAAAPRCRRRLGADLQIMAHPGPLRRRLAGVGEPRVRLLCPACRHRMNIFGVEPGPATGATGREIVRLMCPRPTCGKVVLLSQINLAKLIEVAEINGKSEAWLRRYPDPHVLRLYPYATAPLPPRRGHRRRVPESQRESQ